MYHECDTCDERSNYTETCCTQVCTNVQRYIHAASYHLFKLSISVLCCNTLQSTLHTPAHPPIPEIYSYPVLAVLHTLQYTILQGVI